MLKKLIHHKKILVICISMLCAIAIFLSILFIPKAIKSATKPEGIFVPIIMYHSVCSDTDMLCDYVISPTELENDLKYLKENNYNTIFVKDLINFVHGGGSLPPNPIILTFDDGFYNNLSNALPILEKYDCKATISIVGSYTEKSDQSTDNSQRYSYVTSEQVMQLHNSGIIELGNHSFDMHNLDTRRGAGVMKNESYEEYRNALINDITKNQEYLSENCNIVPAIYTYPYGIVSDPSKRIVKACGFLASLGVEEKPNYISSDPDCLYQLYRYNRPHGTSTEKFMEKALKG
ncbi:MAG: polysaccharide deacetylase family protein [Clostridiales bacterium]|nr:polysaccharide deacetylase family protein [Clostridiales bacterium]